jgi:membrane protease YdiL (CAAX protease family)
MSAVAALLWVTSATFAFLFVGSLIVSAREDAARDQTVLIGCQTAAYLLTLFAILRVHGPESTIREFVGLRGTHAALYPLAAIAGAASAFWGSWLLDRIHRRFPDPDDANRLIELFFEATPRGRIAMGIGIVLVGPVVEELIFRGAIFGPMTRRHPTRAVILWSSALFAVVHVEPRVLVPIFLLGIAMGLLRAASGSLVPSILFHVAFNGVQFADLYTHDAPPPPDAPPEAMPGWQAAAGAAAFAVAMLFAFVVAERSAAAMTARAQDRAT